MDHKEAVRLEHAAEKYVLGEFPQNLRAEYEEHFFDCAECAAEVKAAAAFVDVSREALRAEREKLGEKKAASVGAGWLKWFRPVAAVPAFAVLLLLVGYQNLVSIPRLREVAEQSAQATAPAEQRAAQTAQAAAPHILPTFSLLGANRRGGGRPVFQAVSGKPFVLKVDIPETDASAPSSYVLSFEDESGASYSLGMVSREEAQNTVFVEVPAGFHAGNARLVVLEVPQPGATPREIESLPFVVAFGPEIEHHP